MENEKVMSLALKDIKFESDGIKIKLDCADSAKEGEGKFGTWRLWFGYVENCPFKVSDREKNNAEVMGYTGKVSFFPSDKVYEKLMAAADGTVGAIVHITKHAEDGKFGPYSRYEVKKLSAGENPEATMSETELKLVKESIALTKSGYDLSVDDFVKASSSDIYDGKISPDRAKELFNIMQRMK